MEDFLKQRSEYYRTQAEVHKRKAIVWLVAALVCAILLLIPICI